jgi:hypothetical protein
MDGSQFDAFSRALSRDHSRRGLTRLLSGLALAGSVTWPAPMPTAAKRKKHKKRRGSTVPPPSPPPGPTCTDGVKNGRETDVDCGGPTCPRCTDGKTCQTANDCRSGTCTTGVCVPCAPTLLCGSDAHGACRCDRVSPSNDPVCDSNPPLGPSVQDCTDCPQGTESCVPVGGLNFNCYKRCGSP